MSISTSTSEKVLVKDIEQKDIGQQDIEQQDIEQKNIEQKNIEESNRQNKDEKNILENVSEIIKPLFTYEYADDGTFWYTYQIQS